MTLADWAPVIQAIIAAIAACILACIPIYVPRLLAALEKRTGVAITAQDRAAVVTALQTATGTVQTKLDKGILTLADITPDHPSIQVEAEKALLRVPDSAKAVAIDLETASTIVAARVDTGPASKAAAEAAAARPA